jgi:hypothetical protein
MPNAHRESTVMSNLSPNGKNSLTFESVVCSQLELKRRAASFSRRRSTMCRRQSTYVPATSSNRVRISAPVSQSNTRASTSGILDVSTQFLKANNSNNDGKRSRASSTNSIVGTGLENIAERQSLVSMFYWDGSSSRSSAMKKV